MLEALVGAVVTAVLGGIGWLVVRHLERQSPKYKIEEASQLLAIFKDLAESGASMDDLQDLKERLVTSKQAQKAIQVDLLGELRFQDTQVGMNAVSANLAELADLKVSSLYTQLGQALPTERVALLDESQSAWDAFCEAQARFAASYVEGGSMYPLVYSSEKENLAVQRAASLQAELKQAQEIYA